MTDKKLKKTCGLVMPISSIDGATAEHWAEVKEIITDAVEAISDFDITVKLVSDADDVGVIQKRIVQNLYSSDIVVCDVSGKNPNVMFELGMRLAFDKPTVIVKDDKTDYSFDTGIIEHVPYRRDLRFPFVVTFKKHLADKVSATIKEATSNPNHSTFLKNFGTFSVASLKEAEVSSDKVVIEMLSDLNSEVALLRRRVSRTNRPTKATSEATTALRAGLLSFLKQTGKRADEVLGDQNFYKQIEDEIDAPTYFATRFEFEKTLELELSRLL